MPATSIKQQGFMGADLARLRAGKKTKTGMSESQLKDFASTEHEGLPMIAPKKAALGTVLPGGVPMQPPPAKHAFDPESTIGPGLAGSGAPVGGITHFGTMVAPNSAGKPEIFKEVGLQSRSGRGANGQVTRNPMMGGGGGGSNLGAGFTDQGTARSPEAMQRAMGGDTSPLDQMAADQKARRDDATMKTFNAQQDTDAAAIPDDENVGLPSSADLSPIAAKAPAWQINDRPDGQPEAVKDPTDGKWKTFNAGKKTVITNTSSKPAQVALASQVPALPAIAPQVAPGTVLPRSMPQPPIVQPSANDSGTMSLSQRTGLSETPDKVPDGSAADTTDKDGKPKTSIIPAQKPALAPVRVSNENRQAATSIQPTPTPSVGRNTKSMIANQVNSGMRVPYQADKARETLNMLEAKGLSKNGKLVRPWNGFPAHYNAVDAANSHAADPDNYEPGEAEFRSNKLNPGVPALKTDWRPSGSGGGLGKTKQAEDSHSWSPGHENEQASVWKTPAERAQVHVTPAPVLGSDEINPTLSKTTYGADVNGNRALRSEKFGTGSSNLKTTLPQLPAIAPAGKETAPASAPAPTPSTPPDNSASHLIAQGIIPSFGKFLEDNPSEISDMQARNEKLAKSAPAMAASAAVKPAPPLLPLVAKEILGAPIRGAASLWQKGREGVNSALYGEDKIGPVKPGDDDYRAPTSKVQFVPKPVPPPNSVVQTADSIPDGTVHGPTGYQSKYNAIKGSWEPFTPGISKEQEQEAKGKTTPSNTLDGTVRDQSKYNAFENKWEPFVPEQKQVAELPAIGEPKERPMGKQAATPATGERALGATPSNYVPPPDDDAKLAAVGGLEGAARGRTLPGRAHREPDADDRGGRNDHDADDMTRASRGQKLPGRAVPVAAHMRTLPAISPPSGAPDDSMPMPQAAKGRKLPGMHDPHDHATKKIMKILPHILAAHKAMMPTAPVPPAAAPAAPPVISSPPSPALNLPQQPPTAAPPAPAAPTPPQGMSKGGSLWGKFAKSSTPPVVPAQMSKGGTMDRANTTSTNESGMMRGPGEVAIRPKTGDMQILTKPNAIVKNIHPDPVKIYPTDASGLVRNIGWPSIGSRQ